MSDPFNILGPDFEVPPTFSEAYRASVERLNGCIARFDALESQVPVESYTDDEWLIVESAAAEIECAVERADEGFIAAQYDSHGWYRIMENLEQIAMRLESALGIMELVQTRTGD